jgi:hypothetical protein
VVNIGVTLHRVSVSQVKHRMRTYSSSKTTPTLEFDSTLMNDEAKLRLALNAGSSDSDGSILIKASTCASC